MPAKFTACKYCGKGPLKWKNLNEGDFPAKWILIENDSSPHKCGAYEEEKNNNTASTDKSKETTFDTFDAQMVSVIHIIEDLARERFMLQEPVTIGFFCDVLKEALLRKNLKNHVEEKPVRRTRKPVPADRYPDVNEDEEIPF